MDGHLRTVGNALSRHHRGAAAQRLRPHARRCLRAPGQDGAARLWPRPAGRHRPRARGPRHRSATEHRGLAPDAEAGRLARFRRDPGAPANADGAARLCPVTGGRTTCAGEEGRRRSPGRRRRGCDPGAGGRLLRPRRRQAATTTDGGCACADRQGRAGCPACGGSPAAEGPGGARPPARRERAAPQGRAGGSPAQAGRGRDPAQDRGRDGREEAAGGGRSGREAAPGRRGAAEGGNRGGQPAPGRGSQPEGGRNGRARPAPDGERPAAHPGRAHRAGVRYARRGRRVRRPYARDDRGLAEGAWGSAYRLRHGRTESSPAEGSGAGHFPFR